jgi:hypothetical protein
MGSSRAGNHSDEGAASAGGEERVSRTVIKARTGFRAELPGLDIATLLQMTCARLDRLVVRVTSAQEEGFIYSADGNIVHATLGSLVGEEAVLGMMRWVGGEFAIVERPFPDQPTIHTSTEGLLLLAAQHVDDHARSSAPPLPALETEATLAAQASTLPSHADEGRTSTPPPVSHGLPPVSPRMTVPPPGLSASPSAPPPLPRAPARDSVRPPPRQRFVPPVRDSFVPPARESFAPPVRDSFVPRARDSFMPTTRNATVPDPHPVPRASLADALYESYDEEDDEVPTLLPPPSPRAVLPRRDSTSIGSLAGDASLEPGNSAPFDARALTRSSSHEAPRFDTPPAPRRSKVPPPPPSGRRSAAPNEPANVGSALIASVRVDSNGAVVGTFAGEGTGDLLPQLVAYATRLIALLRADFALDPFEALHAELSGMRIMLFEDAGEMVGLMMRPGSAVQELRQRLGV